MEPFILKARNHMSMEQLTDAQQKYLFVVSAALNQYRIPLPKPEDFHRLLSIGNPKAVEVALESFRHTIKTCVTTYSDRLGESGWALVSFSLVRIATFAQLLADFHGNTNLTASYINGFHANELGYTVIGVLRMSALTIYNKRMVLPSIDAFSEALEGEQGALFDELKRLFVVNLECVRAETTEWLNTNVSLQPIALIECLVDICFR